MKALRTAAFVVGAAALVASGIGAAVGAGILGGVAAGATTATFAGLSAATFTTIGVALSATAGVLSLAAAAAAPKGTVGGNATKFKIDKEAGIPVAIGRTYVGGNVVHRQYYNRPGSKMKNQLESWVTILSLGLVQSVGPLLIDKAPVAFDGAGQALGTYRGNMWLDTQLGACPEARPLAGPFGTFPGWGATSKLSGLAADLWTLDFDSKNEKFPNGVPERGRVLEGILVYDPRLDSTYPGGSGPCRLGEPSTYVYSECPGPHAITWAYGHYQNGVKMAGGGMRASGIDLAPFVEWSNVCDANNWKVGGLVYSTTDNDWDVLKMICQAGAAEPLPVGAQLSVTFSAPRVSIGTITSADITGDIDAPAMVGRRKRRNTIIPSVRLESHGWEMVPIDPVVVPDYVTIDRGSRPKEISYPLVQNATQGAQLAMYDMLNDRELDGILVPAKIYALGYRPGDCITLQVPEANLIGREVLVRQREIDGSAMGVALTCRTEDSSKHAFALGKTGTPPRTPDLSNPGIDRSAPDADDWAVVGTTLSADGVATPALVITGTADRITATEVIFDYRPYIAGAAPDAGWTGASIEPATVTRKEITSVTATTPYEVGVRYRMRGALSDRLILGPVSTGAFEGVGGGAAAFTMLLTNDVHQLPADAIGNVTSYAGASTTIQVFRGASDVTAEFEVGYDDLAERNPQGLSVAGTYPDFAINGGLDANEATASFTFLIIGKAGTGSAGVTLKKTFSLAKSMPGADGSPPALLSLTASAVVARYDAADALVPGQSISFRATRRNSATATVWYLINSAGEEAFSGTAQAFVDAGPTFWTTSDNDNLTLTAAGLAANMGAHGGALGRISLRASLGAYGAVNDVVAIQKVRDGASGASAFTLIGNTGLALLIEPDQVTKIANSEEWQSPAVFRTAETFSEGCQLSFYPGPDSGPYFDFGLWDADRFDDGGNGGIHADWTWHVVPNGNVNDLQIFNRDTLKGTFGKVAGQMLGLSYDNRFIVATINGLEVARFDIGPGRSFHARGAIKGNNHPIARITWVKAGARGESAPLIRVQWSIDGVTNWHDNYFGADVYQRQSNDAGATWGPAYRIIGENGTVGQDGSFTSFVFKRSATVPPAPADSSGNPPAGWTDGPPAGTDFLWQSKATFRGATQLSSWTAPTRISGEDGFSIATIPPFVIPVFPSGNAKPSWGGGSAAIRLFKGNGEITGGVSYALEGASNMIGLTLSGQTFSFASISADTGFFTIVATYAGISYRSRVSVSKAYDGSAAFRASAVIPQASGSQFNGSGSTAVPGGSTVRVSGSLSYGAPNPSGNYVSYIGRISLFYRNISANGPLTALGTPVDGSLAYTRNNGTPSEPDYEMVDGYVSAAFNFTAPAGDTIFEFSAQIVNAQGNPATVSASGGVSLSIVG